MIFVTVGTQLPFDRLVRTIDQWASARPYADAFAQIGPAQYRPRHMPWAEFLDAGECRRKTEQADVVVAHAGMGSILTALEYGRPVLVMPRLSALGEHRNDHQLDTAKKLLAQGRIFVAFDENQLLEKLEYLNKLQPSERIPVHASSTLIETLRLFATGEKIELPSLALQSQSSIHLSELEDRLKFARSNAAKPGGGVKQVLGGRAELWNGTGSSGLVSAGENWSGRSTEAAEPADYTDFVYHHSSLDAIKSGLVAVVLLAGRLRSTDLGKQIGRSRLDLPIDADRSLLTYLRDEVARLAESWGCHNLAMRVLLDQGSLTPALPLGIPGITLSVERDHAEFRGTGGVLRDVCESYDDDAWVLVANAAQILFEPLKESVEKLADAGGEVNVVNEDHGIPNGLILLRCGVLRSISEVGFHDMKEQVVPALAARRLVKVVSGSGTTSPPIHTLKDYTAALRRYQGGHDDTKATHGAFAERWQPRFAIKEQGAVVAHSAVIHDSVILSGAAVERGAVVVRSVVGGGARILPGQVVVDRVIS
jgi:UDP-N-acetylglucosamine transferase subunit ALG13